jgi:hypothetical protein
VIFIVSPVHRKKRGQGESAHTLVTNADIGKCYFKIFGSKICFSKTGVVAQPQDFPTQKVAAGTS